MAIDFGTCFTTAAVRVAQAGPVVAVEIENSRYLPSLVCLDDAGVLLTGRAAVQLAAQRPERAELGPKRALLRQRAVLLDGCEVVTVDLAAAVLARAAAEARTQNGGGAPVRTVLTHPADWSPADLGRLVEAAVRAGIDDPELLAEPVAAARFHAAAAALAADAGHADGSAPYEDRPIAVYDLGGGTVDIAVLRREGGEFKAVAVAGNPDFGGRDLDQALFELLRDRALDVDPAPWYRLWPDPASASASADASDAATAHQRFQLARELTLAKESLSSTGTVYLAVPGYRDPFVVQGGEYRAAVTPALTASVDLLERALALAGVSPEDLAAVVLCGAAGRTPVVADLIAARLGRLPELAADPKAVVALGALTDPPASPGPADGAGGAHDGADAGQSAKRWAVTHYPDEDDPRLDGRRPL
ncbi:Hsp70 family protein [Streptomyces sp. BE20]|uniref:Hsp70 family protein n=1 Tax=Streptomyces sp. BE20 TaxID=3002525 RepID=UPI002E76BC6F|nr:Hsp70 family protein [Streptomyces sp. BE20]MEE1824905.1 Hsp70 family protein [Streptomyces sp. BE20]